MDLLTRQERSNLFGWLLNLPGVEADPQRRRLLIRSQPPSIRRSFNPSDDPLIDIDKILDLVDGDGRQLENGEWPIIWLLEDCGLMADELEVAGRLEALRGTLAARALARMLQPARGAAQQQAIDLPQPHLFDMRPLSEAFRRALLRSGTGLLGFDICHSATTFAELCSSRLVEEFKPRALYRATGFDDLDLLTSPPVDVVERIDLFKRQAERSGHVHLLYSLLLNCGEEQAAELADSFWQLLRRQYPAGFRTLLIVLVFNRVPIPPRDGVVRLDAPSFEEVDCDEWINRVLRGKPDWHADADQIIGAWRHKMMAYCQSANGLNIQKVYRHMNEAIQNLQDHWHDRNYSYTQFLDALP
jgi:hypothetical protein